MPYYKTPLDVFMKVLEDRGDELIVRRVGAGSIPIRVSKSSIKRWELVS